MRITGTVKLNPRIRSIRTAFEFTARDYDELRRDIDEKAFSPHEDRLFLSEGASGGTPWAPLSKPYADRKAHRYKAAGAVRRAAAHGRGTRGKGRAIKAALLGKSGALKSASSGPRYNTILRSSGNLWRGLSSPSHPDHIARLVLTGARARFEFGTKNPLAAIHKVGGRLGNHRPPRDPGQYRPTLKVQVGEITIAWLRRRGSRIAEALRAAGGRRRGKAAA